MDQVFDKWLQALDSFRNSVTKDLDEIRRHKREIQQLRQEIAYDLSGGYFLRDEKRLVLSAPEIIIGNVDRSGESIGEGNIVIIRGGNVNVEGIGKTGKIEIKAPGIYNIAVDPGPDGKDMAIGSISEIVSQAQSIDMQAHNESEFFTSKFDLPSAGGINIKADKKIKLDSGKKSKARKNSLSDLQKELEDQKKEEEKKADKIKKQFEENLNKIKKLIESHTENITDENKLRANIQNLFEINDEFKIRAKHLAALFQYYGESIAALAETNRQLNATKAQKDKVVTGDDFTKKTTGANITINSEKVNINSVDGEGTIRENPEAAISLNALNINLTSLKKDKSLIDKGNINLTAQTVGISTLDTLDEEKDGQGKLKKGNYPAKGDVIIKSKNVSLKSVDYEFKDNKKKEKSLTAGGRLSARFENVNIETTDTEGKATGKISLNSKKLKLRSMDLDKDSRKPKELSKDSSAILLSNVMFIGDSKQESNAVQIFSDTVRLFGKSSVVLSQGKDYDSNIAMTDKNMAFNSGNVEFISKATKLYSDIKITEGSLTAPTATITELEVKSNLKTPSITDGFSTGGAPLKTSAKKSDPPLVYDEENADADDGTRD